MAGALKQRLAELDWRPALLASALILAVPAAAAWLDEYSESLFYRAVQEDEALEWATFWAFLLAAGASALAALRRRRRLGGVPWFLAGVALFCAGIAMEEISWGQRVFGYRPPAYFLEHNFQQEFNAHNLASKEVRKLVFRAVIAGYGIALPLLAWLPPTRRLCERLGIDAPSPLLAPAFGAMLWTTVEYPWSFTNEFVELMLGLGFLFPALAIWQGMASAARPGLSGRAVTVVAGSVLVLTLGVANAAVSRLQRRASPEAVAQATQELEALRGDMQTASADDDGYPPLACRLHKRVFSIVERYDADYLLEGSFAGLVEQGLPEERASFFLDPWNYAYWIRTSCSEANTKWRVFVYSFGPNQRRDSGRWELGGDDIGLLFEGSADDE